MGHARWVTRTVRRCTPLVAGFPLVVCAAVVGCGGGEPARSPAPEPPKAASAPAEPANPAFLAEVQRGVAAGEYRIRQAGEAFEAVNRQTALRARWSSKLGLSAWSSEIASPSATDTQVSLKAVSVGRGAAARALRGTDYALGGCRSDGIKDEHGVCLKRIERDFGTVKEWWENRGDGIAQGFHVNSAPGGKAGPSDWLRVTVKVSGARVQLEPGANRALLSTKEGRLAYSGLAAWDADKKSLPTRMRRGGNSLYLEVDDRNARYPILIDPVLTKHVWEFASGEATSGLDMVVAGGQDVNGDTFPDVAVAFPRYDVGGADSGIVYLFLGSATGPDTTPDWQTQGTNLVNGAEAAFAGGTFGRSLTLGHINGDTFADLVVGQSSWTDNAGTELQEGRVLIYFGSGTVGQPLPVPRIANRVIQGRVLRGLFGRGVALGNLDGAGPVRTDDLVVGAPGSTTLPAGLSDTGRVEIFLNDGTGGYPADGAVTNETVVGAAASHLGLAVATGDVNNDGRADVHAVAFAATTFLEGAVYSLLTDASGNVVEASPFIFLAGEAGAQLSSLAYAGRVDGDVFGDLVAGAPGHTTGGAVFLLHGSAAGITATHLPTPSGFTRIVSGIAGRNFGVAVAGPVDVDNDGFFDVVAGANRWDDTLMDQGGVFVIRGSATGPVTTAAESVDTDSRFFGLATNDFMGGTVAVAGDVNGDGFGDIIVGASGFNALGAGGEGKAYIFLGGLPTAKMQGAACLLNSECASGFCVDGFCCNAICGGTAMVEADNTTDCNACSMALSGAPNGTCDPIPAASTCTSNNACLMGGLCDAIGGCTGGVPKVCTAIPDGCHDPGVCDPGTGICSNPVKANGTVCTDGNACTSGETCQTGVCTVGTTVTCAAAPACKMPGVCNTTTGVCEYANIPDGTACTDANMCTTGDICTAGVCVPGTPTVCAAATMCKAPGVCDVSTGVCSQLNLVDGTPCDDGNMCTVVDTCVAGACSSGAARNCDDSNICTTDTCVAGTGCVNAPIGGCPVVEPGVDADVPPDLPIDLTPDLPEVGVDVPPDTVDVPRDMPDVPDMMRDMSPELAAERPPEVGTEVRIDTAPIPDSGVDAPRDTSGRDSKGVKVGGGGCDCEVGGSEANGTIQLSMLVGLALVVSRIRRRRK
jgi:hypothetical protein